MAAVAPVEAASVPAEVNEDGIKNTLKRMFENLIHVRVITVVGKATVTLPADGEGPAAVATGNDPLDNALITIFNLVEGDVTNVIAPELKDDQAVRDFHSAQVEKSMNVLPSNIATLMSFGKDLIDLLRS